MERFDEFEFRVPEIDGDHWVILNLTKAAQAAAAAGERRRSEGYLNRLIAFAAGPLRAGGIAPGILEISGPQRTLNRTRRNTAARQGGERRMPRCYLRKRTRSAVKHWFPYWRTT